MYTFHSARVITGQLILLLFLIACSISSSVIPDIPEYGSQYINFSLPYPGAQPRSLRFQPDPSIVEESHMPKDHVLSRNRRSYQSSSIFERQVPGAQVPLTPVIDASHPHTDHCTIDKCRAKCIVRNLGTCTPKCMNSACYCQCPDPNKPWESFTPSPPVKLVPDLQYETPIDYLRPPVSPPLDDLKSPPRYPGSYGQSQGQYRPSYPPSEYGYKYPGYGQDQWQGPYGNGYQK